MESIASFISDLGVDPLLGSACFLFFVGLGNVLPEEICLVLTGIVLRATGRPYVVALAASVLALAANNALFFGVTRLAGPKLLRLKVLRRIIRPERIEEAERRILGKGPRVIFACRFIPGFRFPLFLAAGCLRLPARRFFFYDVSALVVSASAWLGLGYTADLSQEGGLESLSRILRMVTLAAIAFLGWRIISRRERRNGPKDVSPDAVCQRDAREDSGLSSGDSSSSSG